MMTIKREGTWLGWKLPQWKKISDLVPFWFIRFKLKKGYNFHFCRKKTLDARL